MSRSSAWASSSKPFRRRKRTGEISSTDVRARYDGELVYGANWGNPAIGNTVNWWDAVDYVGIDAYYPLTGVNNPTPAQLQTAWTNRANQIETWRNSVAPDKQVIFTEVGYQALDGANVVPYGATSSTIDMREQADAIRRCWAR